VSMSSLPIEENYARLLRSVLLLLITVNVVPNSPIIVTLMMEVIFTPKHQFLQEPHGVTSQKTVFFIVTALKTSDFIQYLRRSQNL
jgi:hypothetical protein